MSPPIPVPPLLKGISTNLESAPLGSMSVGDIQKLLDERFSLAQLRMEGVHSLSTVSRQKAEKEKTREQKTGVQLFHI